MSSEEEYTVQQLPK